MRKNSIQTILLFILCGTFLLLSGCKKKDSSDDSSQNPQSNSYNVISGVVKDGVSLQPLPSCKVMLENFQGETVKSVFADANGKYQFSDVASGKYKVVASPDNYYAMTADTVDVSTSNPKGNYVAFCPVDENVTAPVACISGIALDKNGNPLSHASISISSDPEEYSNGYFSSTYTDENGYYILPAIAVNTESGYAIPAFKLRLVKSNYTSVCIKGIVLTQNVVKVKNFTVYEGSSENVLYQESFESESGWTYDGFWHRQLNNSIINAAYPKYVKLGAGDDTKGAIPSAFDGKYDVWFGEALSGNFMGSYDSTQSELSGGTSDEQHNGNLTSPEIALTSANGHATLSFYTWFEIESVNPNSSGYDIMEVEVINVSDPDNPIVLGRLNPYSDPIVDDRAALPYTSGGFNLAPVWKYQEFDISDFIGETIKLRFSFNTEDELYNGFRGWFIDNIRITDATVKSSGIPYLHFSSHPSPRR